ATTQGRTLTGLLAEETPAAVRLRRAEGLDDVIPRDEIEALRPTGRSLMPDGLEQVLDLQDVADLIAFLRSRAPDTPPDDSRPPRAPRRPRRPAHPAGGHPPRPPRRRGGRARPGPPPGGGPPLGPGPARGLTLGPPPLAGPHKGAPAGEHRQPTRLEAPSPSL